MMELMNIKKTYHVSDIETKALDGISVSFREKEFVAILGTSGSGKTTCHYFCVFSGALGVTIAWLLTFPINALIKNMTGLTNASHLQLNHAILLVIISTVITVLGGHIPAKMASKKDAVEALRSE